MGAPVFRGTGPGWGKESTLSSLIFPGTRLKRPQTAEKARIFFAPDRPGLVPAKALERVILGEQARLSDRLTWGGFKVTRTAIDGH